MFHGECSNTIYNQRQIVLAPIHLIQTLSPPQQPKLKQHEQCEVRKHQVSALLQDGQHVARHQLVFCEQCLGVDPVALALEEVR